MKKPNKKSSQSSEYKSKTVAGKMVEYMDSMLTFTKDLIDMHELGVYLDRSGDVNEGLVEESEDITPEQAATLGGYIAARRAADSLHKIKKGESVPLEGISITKGIKPIIARVNRETGEVEVLDTSGDLPKEITDAIKDFVNEMENEDE